MHNFSGCLITARQMTMSNEHKTHARTGIYEYFNDTFQNFSQQNKVRSVVLPSTVCMRTVSEVHWSLSYYLLRVAFGRKYLLLLNNHSFQNVVNLLGIVHRTDLTLKVYDTQSNVVDKRDDLIRRTYCRFFQGTPRIVYR